LYVGGVHVGVAGGVHYGVGGRGSQLVLDELG